MSRISKLAVAVAVVSLVSLASASLHAATFYVATNGSDSNPGSITQPFATITHASKSARAGDIVYVRGGVYQQLVEIASRGTASARILFSPYPGEQAVIDGSGGGTNTNAVLLYATEYVDFSGFEVRNANRMGILAYKAKHTRILDNVVRGTVKSGIYVSYSSAGHSHDITVSGNTVYDAVLENQNHNMSTGWSQSIGIWRTDRSIVTNNRVYRTFGEGIVIGLSTQSIVSRNEVFDNYSVQIYLDNARSTVVSENLVYSTGDSRYYRGGHPAHGIGMANETYRDTNPLSDNQIINNLIVNSRYGIYYGNYESGGGLKSTLIANNTVYNATDRLLSISSDAHSGSLVANNIFYQVSGSGMASVAGSGITYRNNNWYGGSAGAAAGSGDVVGDPRLAKPGSFRAEDYRLTSSSPVIAAGVTLSQVPTDFFGASRGSANDIGKHHLGGATAPAPDTQAPSVPTGLTVTGTTTSSINLAWNASTDNVGVTGYRIYRNGSFLTSIGGTSYSDSGLASSTSYSYRVSAFDAAGNESAQSSSVTGTTSAATLKAMRVANVAIDVKSKGSGWDLTPTVTVVDADGRAVSGATVTGSWSGAATGTLNAVTDSSGNARFQSQRTTNTGTATFTVNNVSHSTFVYNSSLNTMTSASVTLSGTKLRGAGKQ
jgi:parallel beta-helix repeat protein